MFQEHRWIAKAIAQKAVSKFGLLSLYHHGQLVAGRLQNFHPRVRIEYAGKLAADLGLEKLRDAVAVEIGTGWVPVVPMGLYLLGVREIYSFDLTRHLMPELACEAARRLPECFEELSRRSGASVEAIRARFATFAMASSWDSLASRIGLHYFAPVDITQSAIAPASVDIVYSNLVLEHLTGEALERVLAHSIKVLRPGGLCWHKIDYTDHYAQTHKGLSAINFLRYGDRFWSLVGQNDILYLNRLRRSDYLAAFGRAGYEISSVQDDLLPESALIARSSLHPQFARRSHSDLQCASSTFVLRKP